MKKIKLPFCCYGSGMRYWGVGRIVHEEKKWCQVLYSRSQQYSPESWDKQYLVRFETLKEAIDEYENKTGNKVPESAHSLEEDWVEKALGRKVWER